VGLKCFLWWGGVSVLLGQVSLQGVAVMGSNSIEVCWSAYPTSKFYAYYINFSQNGAPYTTIDSVMDPLQMSYIYTYTGSIQPPASFQIVMKDTVGGNSIFYVSEVVSIVFPTIQNVSNNIVSVSWNEPKPGTSPYTIYRSVNGGSLSQAGTSILPYFVDTVPGCSGTVSYVVMSPGGSCQNISFPSAPVSFEDHLAPPVPILDSISISDNGTLVLGWERPPYDVAGYYVLVNNQGSWSIVADIPDPNTTFYDTGIGVGGPMQAGISAYDGCIWNGTPNTSAMTPPHKSIYLQSQYDTCTGYITLTWNKYEGWQTQNTIVLVSRDGSPYSEEGQVPPSSSSWRFKPPKPGRYCFRVRAYSSGFASSSSNEACVDVPPSNILTELKILNASYIDSAGIFVLFDVEPPSPDVNFAIQYSEVGGDSWHDIGVIPSNGQNRQSASFSFVPRPNVKIRLEARNKCGMAIMQSQYVMPIFLKVSPGADRILMEWSSYLGSPYPISYYKINRIISSEHDTISPVNERQYTDYYMDFPSIDYSAIENVCYYVEGVWEGDTLMLPRSNTVCISPYPLLWIPNAFTPNGDGINDEFRIGGMFASSQDITIIVFDRFGNVIHDSSANKEWKGDNVPEGVYPCLIINKRTHTTIRHFITILK